MNVDLSRSSIVQWFERSGKKSHCGYCKNDGSISNGMWAESLSVDNYQDLIDRGWRRSGKYCYKPIMDKICCPQYPIKCDAVNLSLSKSQKKIIKKFNKFLRDGELNRDNSVEFRNIEEPENCSLGPQEVPTINLENINFIALESSEEQLDTEKATTSRYCEKSLENIDVYPLQNAEQVELCDKVKESSQTKSNLKTALKEGAGADPNRPPCKKAKLLRIEKKREKALKQGIAFEKTQTPLVPKSIEEFLEEAVFQDNKFNLRMSLIPTSTPNLSWKETEETEFELYKKYQMAIHQDPPSKLSLQGFNRFLVTTPLKTSLERMSRTHENFSLNAELYKKYQIIIHNDSPEECNESQFYDFLVETPLKPQSFPEGIDGPGYGSFHQQYWLNDKLIAVGVIDILPRCVSSVYFFYDPDYRSLTLGTYGSIRELHFTRELHRLLPDLRSYYMGFYVHSCPKMRYKGKLTPSFLACPETYAWIPIEKCLPLLDADKYSRLNHDLDAIDSNLPCDKDILETKVIYKYQLMTFKDYRKKVDKTEKFRQIGVLVGKICLKRLIFWE